MLGNQKQKCGLFNDLYLILLPCDFQDEGGRVGTLGLDKPFNLGRVFDWVQVNPYLMKARETASGAHQMDDCSAHDTCIVLRLHSPPCYSSEMPCKERVAIRSTEEGAIHA
eukprot:384048-Amphidinium_carterae.2